MEHKLTTMTRTVLEEAIEQARRHPHKHVHKGELIISPEVFETPGRETNLLISRFSMLDCTGSIRIGPWCNISARCRIYTHDHIHMGLEPLLAVEEEHGVIWQDKVIGADVWIHDSAMVLSQATHIPDGVVLGAGAVLTKNPGPYEIWAGVPAVKIDKRTEVDPARLRELIARKGFSLA